MTVTAAASARSVRRAFQQPWGRLVAVTLVLLLAVGVPRLADLWSAPDTTISTADLLQRIRDAENLPYSGYVEAEGGLALPMAQPFDEFVALSSAPSRLRVWWQDAATWRIDRLQPLGEESLYHEGDSTISWDEESLEATRTQDGLALIPETVDLLPPRLAAWSLDGVDGVDGDDISRLPPSRVAGVEAAGLRIIPAGGQATVRRVDVWADPDTGLPLRVQIWGPGRLPAVDTRFLDVEFAYPPEEVTTFRPPQGVFLAAGGSGLIGHIPGVYRSVSLAGLHLMPQHATEPVTRYGQGVTQLLVIALDDQVAEPLRHRLGVHPAAAVDRRGTWLSTGPLHLLLTPCVGHTASWLLAGTVDDQTLLRASRDVRAKTWEISPKERSC